MGKNQSASGLTNIIQYDNNGNVSFVSGSTTLMQISSSGAITTTGVISGSNALSASYSLNSGLLNGTGSVGFATTGSLLTVSSSQQQISASYIALSASYNTFSGSASTRITENSSSIQQVSSSQQQISASLLNVIAVYATTGSNSFRATQSITGSLTVTGQIIAQTLNVQQVTSSIIYSSGSNNFGCDLNSRQTFTGSVLITGSLTIAGASSATSYSGTTIYGSTVVCSPVGKFTSCIDAGSGTFSSCVTATQFNVSTSGGATQIYNTGGGHTVITNATANKDMNIQTSGTGGQYFNTAGVDRLIISSTGAATFACSVGIGVSPSFPLEISSATGNQLKMSTNDATSANNAGIFFYNESSATSSTRRSYMLLDPNGANGSGGDYTYFDMYGSGTARVMNQLTSGVLALGVGGTNIINITGSNVGIGTNAPTRLLDVSNTSGDSTIVITSADATGQSSLFYGKPSDANIGGVLYNHCNNQMSFRVNDATRMSITSCGNVGIGTCTPVTQLEIKGTNAYHKVATCFFSTYNAGFAFSDYEAGITYEAGGNTMCLYSNYTGYGGIVLSTCGSPRVFVNVGGVVRMGTCAINANANSNVALQVAGAIRFGNPDGDYVTSYGGGISARALSLSPGSATIIIKGLGGSGFLYQVQGFTGTGKRFTDLVMGINNILSVVHSVTEATPATRSYTITSENLNLCLSGADTYNIISHGFGAVER